MNNIEEVINYINYSFDKKYSDKGFLNGSNHSAISFFTTQSCWYYSYILKRIFPKGEIYLGDYSVGHVVFKLNNQFYDVNGQYYMYNIDSFYCDSEVIGSPVYDHRHHKAVISICNNIVDDIYNKYPNTNLDSKITKGV